MNWFLKYFPFNSILVLGLNFITLVLYFFCLFDLYIPLVSILIVLILIFSVQLILLFAATAVYKKESVQVSVVKVNILLLGLSWFLVLLAVFVLTTP